MVDMDIVDDVTCMGKSVFTHVAIQFLLQDVIH